MNDAAGAETETEIHRLHELVDAEVAMAESSEASETFADPDLQAYEARLANLHDAVVAMETYEDGLGSH